MTSKRKQREYFDRIREEYSRGIRLEFMEAAFEWRPELFLTLLVGNPIFHVEVILRRCVARKLKYADKEVWPPPHMVRIIRDCVREYLYTL